MKLTKKIYTTEEAAKILGLSLRRAQELVKNGHFPSAIKRPLRGFHWEIEAADIEKEWIRRYS